MSSTIPIPTIPSMTNGSWDFVDTFGPPPLPYSTVSTTPLMENLDIPTMPSLGTIVTPNMIGTQYIPVSTAFVSSPGPSTSIPYSAPYRKVSTGPFNNPFGWNPFFSSNPQVQIPRGTVPNMHILTRNITVPPPFKRQNE